MGHQKRKGTATQCLFFVDDSLPNRIPTKPKGLVKRVQDLWGKEISWHTQGFRVPDGFLHQERSPPSRKAWQSVRRIFGVKYYLGARRDSEFPMGSDAFSLLPTYLTTMIPAKPQGLAKRAQDLLGKEISWHTQGFRVPDGVQEHLDPAPSQVSGFPMGHQQTLYHVMLIKCKQSRFPLAKTKKI